MESLVIAATTMQECVRCSGLWLDVTSFERICADREQQSAVLGTASLAPTKSVHETSHVNYVPCPECSQLMNRINFARCSGVIVDICKGHGTWFDRDELSRIVEFIRSGGLEASRAKEKANIEEERRHLRQEQLTVDMQRSVSLGVSDADDHRLLGIASTHGLLKFLLD
jgi:Zn-finger nucleic acid-binding protein